MIVKPRIRGFICTTAHPAGCAAHVNQQIDYVIGQGDAADGAFGNVLVLVQAATGSQAASLQALAVEPKP